MLNMIPLFPVYQLLAYTTQYFVSYLDTIILDIILLDIFILSY